MGDCAYTFPIEKVPAAGAQQHDDYQQADGDEAAELSLRRW